MVAIHKPAHDIILKPVVSEKSYALSDRGQYTFVNTLNRAGKHQRTRTGFGQRVSQKRAIVTVAEGQSIDIFGN